MALKIKDDWWTAPAEAENGRLVMVSGRYGAEAARDTGKYDVRVTLAWDYAAGADGMPDEAVSKLMEEADEAMKREFAKDPIGVMTGIYTGDGRREWVFYTRSLPIFGRVLNRALAELPQLPLDISAESDPEWLEYAEMRDATYIPPEE